MRTIWWIITIFVVFILQSTIFPFLFNGITQPNLILVFVILIALHLGSRPGIIAALVGGLSQDVLIGNFFGLHLLPYLIIVFICSSMGESFDRGQRILSLLVVLVGTELYLVLLCAVLWSSGQYVELTPYLVQYSVPLLIYHAICIWPVHRVVWHLRNEDTFSFEGYR
jgi:rod shape-determining protein MreD